MRIIHLSEALRMFRRSRYVNKHGFRQYKGTPKQIAEQIVDSCWNKKDRFFMVSSGHFCQFYSRDFGMSAEALVKLGHKKKVIQTLNYALKRMQKHGSITTTISPKGKPFDFPTYGADSLPFLIHAIRAAKATPILKKYRSFLMNEIEFYFEHVFDPHTDLVYQHKHFSSMKDYSQRNSSCYSNCMLSMLRDDLQALNFYNPFIKHDIKKAIIKNFWNGKYFHEDLSKTNIVTGDANTYPFWCNVTTSKDIFKKCLVSMDKAGLTKPFPLKYAATKKKTTPAILRELFAGDYERDTVWIHLGLCFLDTVKQYDKKRFNTYMKQYEHQIKKHKNFLELYDRNGEPFKTPFYIADEGMLWVSKYLALKKN
jgi:hypothetical protein